MSMSAPPVVTETTINHNFHVIYFSAFSQLSLINILNHDASPIRKHSLPCCLYGGVAGEKLAFEKFPTICAALRGEGFPTILNSFVASTPRGQEMRLTELPFSWKLLFPGTSPRSSLRASAEDQGDHRRGLPSPALDSFTAETT